MFFKFWGDGSDAAKALVDAIKVRSTDNFNWTFIFILAVVFYVYWSEIHKKNYKAVFAGLALYGGHGFSGQDRTNAINKSVDYLLEHLKSNI